MKKLKLLLILLPMLAWGQDSLVIDEIGEFPGGHILDINGNWMLTQQWVEDEFEFEDGYLWLVLLDITQRSAGEEILRCMSVPDQMDHMFHYYWADFGGALIYDSLLIATPSAETLDDVIYFGFDARIVVYDTGTRESIWSQRFEFMNEHGERDDVNLPHGLAVSNDILYVGMGTLGIYIFDFANPITPEQIAHLDYSCIDLAIMDNLLVFSNIRLDDDDVYNFKEYLTIADVSDPTDPQVIYDLETYYELWDPSSSVNLQTYSNYLYLAPHWDIREESLIDIYRIDEEEGIVLERQFQTGVGLEFGYSISEGRLFVRTNDSLSISALDDPVNPELLINSYSNIPNYYSGGIRSYGNFLYLSRTTRNIRVFYFGPDAISDRQQSHSASAISINGTYPNPFNSSVRIGFDLPEAQPVSLKIYDTSGSMVAEPLNRNLSQGSHRVTWTADDFPAGIYIAQLSTPSAAKTAKLVLVK